MFHDRSLSARARRTGSLLLMGLAALLFAPGVVPGVSSPAAAAESTVPLLVGPQSVRLAGGAGTYRWSRVEFATRVARLDWRVAAGSAGCTVAARVMGSDGQVRGSDRVSVAATASQDPRSFVTADYVSGGLTIVSDCPRWKLVLTPQDDAGVNVGIERVTYRVTGRTARQIWDSMRSRSPWGWPGYTSWSWASACGTATVKVGLPVWTAPSDAPSLLVRRWRRYERALRTHEMGHATFVLQSVGRADGCLDSGGWSNVAERSQRYDELTDHGRTQGAVWTY